MLVRMCSHSGKNPSTRYKAILLPKVVTNLSYFAAKVWDSIGIYGSNFLNVAKRDPESLEQNKNYSDKHGENRN